MQEVADCLRRRTMLRADASAWRSGGCHMTDGRIVVDPRIMAGKPVVRGTRIPVELVLKRLSQDLDLPSLYESYPRLTDADVKACLAYATAVVQGEDVFPELVTTA